MDLSQFFRSESSAFADRLLAAVEERAQRIRDEVRDELQDARTQLETLRAALERETSRAAALETDLENVIEAHRTVDAERARLEADLEQVIEAHRVLEAERTRFATELREVSEAQRTAEADRARLEDDLQGTRELLQRARSEAERLSEALEREVAHLALVRNELATAHADMSSLEAARTAAEGRVQQLEARLSDVASGEETVRAQLAAAEADHQRALAEAEARHQVALEDVRAEHHRALTGVEAEHRRILAEAEAERNRAVAEAAAERQRELEEAAATAAALRAEFDAEREALRGEMAALQAARDEALAERDALRRDSAALDTRAASAEQLLARAAGAVEALGQSSSVDALFHELAIQVSAHVPRVVLFRARGNHLEGTRGVGLDDGIDIKKLMIPVSVDSLVARALAAGTLVRADREQLAAAHPPVGGAAVSAVAVPLVVDEQPFAVLYADAPEEIGAAHATATLLLVRHAVSVLQRLAREFKAIEELREYAAMLVDEAAQIFHADLDAGCPEAERLHRLRSSIDYARELYAHRAALEGHAAAGLFDTHLAEVGDKDSAFGQALTDLLEQLEIRRTAS